MVPLQETADGKFDYLYTKWTIIRETLEGLKDKRRMMALNLMLETIACKYLYTLDSLRKPHKGRKSQPVRLVDEISLSTTIPN